MYYHGNYCGPGWSDGEYQSSVVGSKPAIDEFDETCRLHDAAYALGMNLNDADDEFVESNFGHGAKRSLAAAAVALQRRLRANDSFNNPPNSQTIMPKMNKATLKKGNLRGSNQPSNAQKQSTLSTVPAAYGYTLRMQKPSVVRRGNTATIVGSDYAGTVQVANSGNYQPAASVFINPAYFQNAMLGSQARTFEKFRVKRGVVSYIPSVPTSTQGQIVMLSTSTVKEPFIAGGTSGFLGRALSQHNAVATPIWKEANIELSCNSEWSVVDALIDGDLDDCIAEEVQVYGTCDSTVDAGILIFHYEIEFKDPLYVYHPTLIPVPNGNGQAMTAVDNSAVNAVSDAIRLNGMSPAIGGGAGSVYRLVFQQARSIQPTGPASWASVAKVETISASTISTTTGAATTIAMITGTTLYALFSNSELILYSSLEAAANGGSNGVLNYATITSAIGVWSFLCQMVRIGDGARITTQ